MWPLQISRSSQRSPVGSSSNPIPLTMTQANDSQNDKYLTNEIIFFFLQNSHFRKQWRRRIKKNTQIIIIIIKNLRGSLNSCLTNYFKINGQKINNHTTKKIIIINDFFFFLFFFCVKKKKILFYVYGSRYEAPPKIHVKKNSVKVMQKTKNKIRHFKKFFFLNFLKKVQYV